MELKDFSKEQLSNELKRRETITSKFPQKLDNPDWDSVIKICEEYINTLVEERDATEDMDHSIFETALEAVYGKDVWAFVNTILQ